MFFGGGVVDRTNGSAVARLAGGVWELELGVQAISTVGAARSFPTYLRGLVERCGF